MDLIDSEVWEIRPIQMDQDVHLNMSVAGIVLPGLCLSFTWRMVREIQTILGFSFHSCEDKLVGGHPRTFLTLIVVDVKSKIELIERDL